VLRSTDTLRDYSSNLVVPQGASFELVKLRGLVKLHELAKLHVLAIQALVEQPSLATKSALARLSLVAHGVALES